jgi:lysophospholipase L1-like esterase
MPQTSAPPPELLRLGRPLPRTAARLARRAPLTIVAFGSSSTEGAGASAPDRSYPGRLETALGARCPRRPLRVLNRGVGGEDAREMMDRYDRDVAAEQPDLVLWQVGTNALVLERSLPETGALIRDGLTRMRRAGFDAVLIDPQYCPALAGNPDTPRLLALLEELAGAHRVGLFRRWEIMRRWREVDGLPFSAFIVEDGLHMNDWSYAEIARMLADALLDGVAQAGGVPA